MLTSYSISLSSDLAALDRLVQAPPKQADHCPQGRSKSQYRLRHDLIRWIAVTPSVTPCVYHTTVLDREHASRLPPPPQSSVSHIYHWVSHLACVCLTLHACGAALSIVCVCAENETLIGAWSIVEPAECTRVGVPRM